MPFITIPISPKEYQISFDDIINGLSKTAYEKLGVNSERSNDTRTVYRDVVPKRLLDALDVEGLYRAINTFMREHNYMYSADIPSQYETFYLHKKGKGLPTLFKYFYSHEVKTTKLPKKFCQTLCSLTSPLFRSHNHKEHEELLEKTVSNVVEYASKYCRGVDADGVKKAIKDNFRRIDAPMEGLKHVQDEMRNILKYKFFAKHHTIAFSYIEKRCTVDAVKRHQENNSRWFLKLDLKNFFNSVTPEFLVNQLEMIYPFSEVIKAHGKQIFVDFFKVCFLEGGLPQGTPISPDLTNIMMIPIDHVLAKMAREHSPHLCITRYADDLIVSSEYSFRWTEVQKEIISILKRCNAPFELNTSKTHYGSSAGRNWNLGIMLNKDNDITVGHQKIREFKASIFNFFDDYLKGEFWSREELNALSGTIAWYRMVEADKVDQIIDKYNKKFGLDLKKTIKALLISM